MGVEAAVMAVLVLWHLGSRSLVVDEGFSAVMARAPWHVFWHAVATREANQSLYYGVLRVVAGLRWTETWLRLVAALGAVATVPALVAVGRRLVGDRAGVIAGGLLCLNGFFVWHAQLARAYTLVVLLVVVSTLLFLRAVEQPNQRRWVAWGAVSALACYAHFFAVFVVAAQLVSLALRPGTVGPRRPFVVGAAAFSVVVAPLAVFVAAAPGDQINWLPRPTVSLFAHTVSAIAGHGGAALCAVVVVLAAVGLAGGAASAPRFGAERSWRLTLLAAWLALPFVLAFGASLLKPLVEDSYLLVTLPALVLLAAAGIDRILDLPSKAPAAVAVAVLLALGGRAVVQAYGTSTSEDWQRATTLVLADARPGDGLLFGTSAERPPFEYYFDRAGRPASAPTPIYPSDRLGHLIPYVAPHPAFTATVTDGLFAGHQRIWVLQRAHGQTPVPVDSARYRLVQRNHLTDIVVSLYAPRA